MNLLTPMNAVGLVAIEVIAFHFFWRLIGAWATALCPIVEVA